MTDQTEKIVYPPGCRELTPDISTDDFVRRLKECAQAFQMMVQEEDNDAYVPLALHLASDLFLEHRSQDVRLIAACCLADIFRIFAPDAPFTDLSQVKVIFEFFVEQLKGLKYPNSPSFKRYFYLLQNFACVRTFNLCVELDNCKDIFLKLFKLMFQIVSEINNNKVEKTVLDMLTALLSESDVIQQEILDIILIQIIEPIKSQSRSACLLAQDLIRRSASALKPYIENYFDNALFMPRSNQSVLSRHLFDLIYELNTVSYPLMTVVLPQLEYKLKSSCLEERLQVVRVVARIFADKHSKMMIQNPTLWTGFLSRFNDIDPVVRILCCEYSKPLLLNHPETKDDLTEQLKPRCRDPEEEVRYAAVMAILGAAKESFSSINEELLSFIKERTLDKKFRIRKEAMQGLARLYKQHSGIYNSSELSPEEMESISWIKNKILHVYYQNSVNDRLLVEKILSTCLVPLNKPIEDRMKMLYKLFCTIDDNAVRAFTEILKCQKNLRTQMEQVLELIQMPETPERNNVIHRRILQLTKHFHDPSRCGPLFLKFFNHLGNNPKLWTMLNVTLQENVSCVEAENKVKLLLHVLGPQDASNMYYCQVKQLLECTVPMLVDREGVGHLVEFVRDSLLGDGRVESELKLCSSHHQGLQLLLVLSYTLPLPFQSEPVYRSLIEFLRVKDDQVSDLTLQILVNISKNLEATFPLIANELMPLLEDFIKTGSGKQPKHAVYCLHGIIGENKEVFGNLISMLREELTEESPHCVSALESIGHIAFLCHNMIAEEYKSIVTSHIVKTLLMLKPKNPVIGGVLWLPFENLSNTMKIKLAAMKVMVKWLRGLRDMVRPALSTIMLLAMMIKGVGFDLESHLIGNVGFSWMRLSAATSILKLCYEPRYAAILHLEHFQTVASIMSYPCHEVIEQFIQKLYKGLSQLKLPLEFMAIMTLSALDSDKSFKEQVKQYLIVCINKRRVYVKEKNLSNDELPYYLPDYALQYAVHLLAHQKFYKDYNDSSSLLKIMECLNLLLEALMYKNEDYNYAFLKKLLENIKQTKDAQYPEDEVANTKMYAVCDLAWSIILSQSNFVLKEFPAEPVLNSRFFTQFDKSYSNMKKYLPPDLAKRFPVKPGFDMTPPAAASAKGTRSRSKANQVPADDSTVLRETSAPDDLDSTLLDCSESPSNSMNLSEEQTSSADRVAIQTEESPPGTRRRSKPSAAVETMKSCQVQVQRLPREEVERYTSSSCSEPQDPEDLVSPPPSPPRRSTRNSSSSSQGSTKRKRDVSQSQRSVRSRTSPTASPSQNVENGEQESSPSSAKVSPNLEILNEVNTVTRGRKRNPQTNYLKENNSSSVTTEDSCSASSYSTKPAKKGKSTSLTNDGLKRPPTKIANKAPKKTEDEGVRVTRTMRSKQEMESQRTTRQKNKQKAVPKRR